MTTSARRSVVLSTAGVNVRFGAFQAVRDVSIDLFEQEILGLIGPNGAGKTTLFNAISGVLKPSSGTVRLFDRDITGESAHKRIRAGIGRTFQIPTVTDLFTPAEMLTLSGTLQKTHGWSAKRLDRVDSAIIDSAHRLLDDAGLTEYAHTSISELPYGIVRAVDILAAIAQRPKVLLLDEPAAGLTGEEANGILQLIASLSDQMSVIIVEHDIDFLYRLAHRIVVLHDGAVLVEGTPSAVASDDRVRDVYFGEMHNDPASPEVR